MDHPGKLQSYTVNIQWLTSGKPFILGKGFLMDNGTDP